MIKSEPGSPNTVLGFDGSGDPVLLDKSETFDIDGLPAAGALALADLVAVSQSGTEGKTDFTAIAALLGGGLLNIQAFTSSGTYTATVGTNAVMVICRNFPGSI